MADFLDSQEVKVEEKEEIQEVAEAQTIKLGEKEYSQDELNRLVELGNIAEEAEKKYNTKIDRVWPEYGRTQTRVKELEQQLEEARKPKIQLPANEEQAIREAKDAARKLGLVTNDDFNDYMNKSFKDMYRQEREAERLLDDVKGLEKEMDGKDGRPRFDAEAVLSHMAQTGINDPNKAYKDMYEKELDAWKMKQFGRKPGMTTATGGAAAKAPAFKKPTNEEELNRMVAEMLAGDE